MDWDIERTPVKQPDTDSAIKELSIKLTELEKKNAILQEDYDKLVLDKYHNDYLVENQKKRIEDIGKTLALYERENKAMRELLRQWI